MRRYLPDLRAPYVFAGVGDIHGQFEDLALVLADLASEGWPRPEFCLAAGDTEALRSTEEMDGVYGPAKYRKLGDFTRVISGEIKLPPLFFTGGNHEPWPALDENGPGRWGLDTYFLGRAGITTIGGLGVANLSGIRSEKVSPGQAQHRQTLRSRCYYVDAEVDQLLRAGRREPVTVLLTHDWPAGVGTSRNGGPAGDARIAELVSTLRPQVAICGHMHHRQTARLGKTTVESLGHIRGGRSAVELFYYDGRRVEALGTNTPVTPTP